MSEAGNAAVAVSENDKAIGELAERFEKKGKVVALVNDDQSIFADFVGKLEGFADWTDGVDSTKFNGMAVVRADNGSVRLIPIASEEEAFADVAVRKALYKIYVNRVVNAAGEDDAQQSQFIIPGGTFKQKFDLDAFKFQARLLVKFLRDQGLSGITINSLRMSFASAAFAKTQFPRVDEKAWDKIIGIAEAQAVKNGYDTSIFDHWKATRAVQTADTSTLELDFEKLLKAEEALGDSDEAEAK